MKKRKKAGEKVLNKIDLPTGLAPNAVMASNLNILFLHCENSLANHVLKIKIQKNVLFRACLHGGGGPQIGEVTCGGSPHLSCKRDQIKMRDYMDRRVTPPKRVTSPAWGPPPPCKQALKKRLLRVILI